MRYCSKCILPESHATIQFDENGVCNVCQQAIVKHTHIDWNARRKMLDDIISRYKGKGEYDCIIPFSGGKDSTFQLWYVVKKLDLKPLVVRYNHWGYRPLVNENNLRTFKILNVDVLEFTSKFDVVKKLMLESLKQNGDFCWHCHTGVFAHTLQIAVKFNIPLIIWGEASSEYAAYHSAEELEGLDANELEKLDETAFNAKINLEIDAEKMYSLLKGTVDKRDLMPFQLPSKEELTKLGIKSICLGNYIKWHTKNQVNIIKQELGWKGQDVEGIPPIYDYEKIECRWQGIRDYCKYIKRGYGRTNHLACIDIRNGEMDRNIGLELSLEYDGKRPASLDDFLAIIGISEDEFEKILLNNSVTNWGFSHDNLKDGPILHDMEQWPNLK